MLVHDELLIRHGQVFFSCGRWTSALTSSAPMSDCLEDRRSAVHTRHSLIQMIRQRVYQIAAGYEDCNDADHLRIDPALRLAIGLFAGNTFSYKGTRYWGASHGNSRLAQISAHFLG